MTLEMGKLVGAGADEAAKCATACRYYAEHGEEFMRPEVCVGRVGRARRDAIHFEPLGVVLAVMPWNFPFWQVIRFAAPALVAGNVGLLKHASNVPQCALALEDLFRRAGAPEGVFQTLLIGSERVPALIADERVAAVTVTGSEAGRPRHRRRRRRRTQKERPRARRERPLPGAGRAPTSTGRSPPRSRRGS